MFLRPLNRDFNEREVKMIDQHINYIGNYLEEFIVPDVIAFYLASGYYESKLYENSLDIFINSVLAQFFNYEVKNLTVVRRNTIKILKIKYNLEISCDCPLRFKKAISDQKWILSDIKI